MWVQRKNSHVIILTYSNHQVSSMLIGNWFEKVLILYWKGENLTRSVFALFYTGSCISEITLKLKQGWGWSLVFTTSLVWGKSIWLTDHIFHLICPFCPLLDYFLEATNIFFLVPSQLDTSWVQMCQVAIWSCHSHVLFLSSSDGEIWHTLWSCCNFDKGNLAEKTTVSTQIT